MRAIRVARSNIPFIAENLNFPVDIVKGWNGFYLIERDSGNFHMLPPNQINEYYEAVDPSISHYTWFEVTDK